MEIADMIIDNLTPSWQKLLATFMNYFTQNQAFSNSYFKCIVISTILKARIYIHVSTSLFYEKKYIPFVNEYGVLDASHLNFYFVLHDVTLITVSIGISVVSRSILGRSGRFLATWPEVEFLGRPRNDLKRPRRTKIYQAVPPKEWALFVIVWHFFRETDYFGKNCCINWFHVKCTLIFTLFSRRFHTA